MGAYVDRIFVGAIDLDRTIESGFFCRSKRSGRRWDGTSRSSLTRTIENVHPRIAFISTRIVEHTDGTILLEGFRIGAHVEKLRALIFRVDIIAVFGV